MNEKQNANRSPKQSAKDIFKISLRPGAPFFPSLNLKNIEEYFAGLSENEITVNKAFEGDIKIFKDFYEKLYIYMMETQPEDRARDNVAVKKLNDKELLVKLESGKELVLDKSYTDNFYKILYAELEAKHGESLVRFAGDYKKFKEQIGLLKEVYLDGSDKILTYLEDEKVKLVVEDLKGLLGQGAESNIVVDKKDQIPEVVSSTTRAGVFETTVGSTEVFPLDEKRLAKYSKDPEFYAPYLELDRIVRGEEGRSYIKLFETDISKSRGPEGKRMAIQAQLELVKKINQLELPLEDGYQFIFRIRALGNFSVDGNPVMGKYRMGNEEDGELSQVVVATADGGLGSVLTTIGFLIDNEVLNGTEVRDLMVKNLRPKVNVKGMRKSYAEYARGSTKMMGNYMALGYILSGRERASDLSSIVRPLEVYERGGEYFGFKDWTQEQKDECLSFYKFFCEKEGTNDITDEQREDFVRNMEGSSVIGGEKGSHETRKWTWKQYEERNYKKLGKLYSLADIERTLANAKRAEEEGEYVEYGVKELVFLFQTLLSQNYLLPHNRAEDIKSWWGKELRENEAMIDNVMSVLKTYFKDLKVSDKLEILENLEEMGVYGGYRRTFSVKSIQSPLKDRVFKNLVGEGGDSGNGHKSLYGYWNILGEDNFLEMLETDPENTLRLFNRLVSHQKVSNKNRKSFKESLSKFDRESPFRLDAEPADLEELMKENRNWSSYGHNFNLEVFEGGEPVSMDVVKHSFDLGVPDFLSSTDMVLKLGSIKDQNPEANELFESLIYSQEASKALEEYKGVLSPSQKNVLNKKAEFEQAYAQYKVKAEEEVEKEREEQRARIKRAREEEDERMRKQKEEALERQKEVREKKKKEEERKTLAYERAVAVNRLKADLGEIDFSPADVKRIVSRVEAEYEISPEETKKVVDGALEILEVASDKVRHLERAGKAGFKFIVPTEDVYDDSPEFTKYSYDAIKAIKEEFNPVLALIDQLEHMSQDESLSEDDRAEMSVLMDEVLFDLKVPRKYWDIESDDFEEGVEKRNLRDKAIRGKTKDWSKSKSLNQSLRNGNLDAVLKVFNAYLKKSLTTVLVGQIASRVAKKKVSQPAKR